MILQAIVYIIIAIFIGISQSAGIGGGPILNICLMLGFGYEAHDSMYITYLFLIGGASASIWKNKDKKNPKTGTPLMDYNLIMITLPMSVTGSLFGTILNHFISQLIITIMFTILLSYLAYNSYQKLIAINREAKQQKLKPLIQQQMKDITHPSIQNTYYTTQSSARLRQIIDYQRQVYPIDKIKIIGQIFVYTIILLLCKGGRRWQSYIGLESCGFGSYVCIILHFLISYLFSKSMAIQQYRRDTQKQNLGYVFQNQSDKMSNTKMNTCMISGFSAGAVGGMLGLGGAIILVPVWLQQGIDKNIATSSSGLIILFSALVSFSLGILSSRYSSMLAILFYLSLAFSGSYIVKQVVNYISDKYNLKSMIFILLIVTMVSSLVTLLPFQLQNFYQDPQGFIEFGLLC